VRTPAERYGAVRAYITAATTISGKLAAIPTNIVRRDRVSKRGRATTASAAANGATTTALVVSPAAAH
jgi:hypothetical protein